MQTGQPSETAIGVAAMRAAHLAGPGPYIFEDPWALRLTSESYREIAKRGELAGFFDGHGVLAILGQILGRARWAEDALMASLDAGVTQLVNLGAGLDSFPQRRPDLLPRLQVFELDHPDTQNYKLARLAELGVARDARVHYVAIDFEQETVDTALARSPFDPTSPCFVIWLGVVTYLTHADVMRTLESLRGVLAVGSQVAIDYPIAPEQLVGEDRALFENIRDGSAGLGEPRRATHDPVELQREITALGFECIEDLSSAEHRARYFQNRSDGLRPYAQVRLARFRAT